MPWRLSKRGSRWCVVKEGESSPVPGGCHPTRAQAVKHQRALYAGEAAAKEEVLVATGDPNPLWWYLNTGSTTFDPTRYSTTISPSLTFTVAEPGSVTDDGIDWQADLPEEISWEGVLAVEGVPTSDGRYLIPGKINHRELPLTLMAQTVTDDGHKGAFAAGKITAIRREKRPDLGDNAVAIIGQGVFADTDEGREAAHLLETEVLRGVSIDFAPTASLMLDPETLEPLEEEEMDLLDLLAGKFLRGFEGDIMGATLCPFPAFEDASMQIVEVGEKVLVASAIPMRQALTASAAGLAPLAPPYEWFFKEEPNHPCPLTVTAEGQVYGHLALWNQCHRGLRASCELAPRSPSGYAFFHTGGLTTEDGRKVNVGRITVGEGGHASTDPSLGMSGAIEHYDKTGTVAAFVRAKDGRYGIWLSGAVRSDVPAEKVRDLEANPPSGDWREEKYQLELGAILSVPVPGFPVPRFEASLVASGAEERVVALIAAGYSEPISFTRAESRKFTRLLHSARSVLSADGFLFDGEPEEFRLYSSAQRRRMARSGAALPDGSFPIANCTDASNAIRAQGRTPASNRGRVRSHIRKRVRALGCSGSIFDPYK